MELSPLNILPLEIKSNPPEDRSGSETIQSVGKRGSEGAEKYFPSLGRREPRVPAIPSYYYFVGPSGKLSYS